MTAKVSKPLNLEGITVYIHIHNCVIYLCSIIQTAGSNLLAGSLISLSCCFLEDMLYFCMNTFLRQMKMTRLFLDISVDTTERGQSLHRQSKEVSVWSCWVPSSCHCCWDASLYSLHLTVRLPMASSGSLYPVFSLLPTTVTGKKPSSDADFMQQTAVISAVIYDEQLWSDKKHHTFYRPILGRLMKRSSETEG